MKKGVILAIGLIILTIFSWQYKKITNEKIKQQRIEEKRAETKAETERLQKERIEEEKVKKEKDEQSQKKIEENREETDRLIKEIENEFSSIDIKGVCGDGNGGITITINMQLLSSIDVTYRECSELTVLKETKLKNVGITSIMIYVKNNSEVAGILGFDLRSGRYEPTMNTF